VLACLLGLALGPLATLPFLLLAVGLAGYSASFWWRMDQARREEDAAVEAAGAASYLTFQIHRVNRLHGSAAQRRRLVLAADALRAAQSEWRLLAGEIPVEWAFEHRGEVARAARRLRSSDVVRNPMAVALSSGETTAAELAEVLRSRVASLEHAGPLGESLPMLLDDPFNEIEPDAKAILLETLTRSAGRCQVIYLTDDPNVASWARVEALTGDLAIVEPAQVPGRERTDAHRHRPTHLIA
jgi:hypothetical protein